MCVYYVFHVKGSLRVLIDVTRTTNVPVFGDFVELRDPAREKNGSTKTVQPT